MCICLADILDADHDLSRKGNELNPLETYWYKHKSQLIEKFVNDSQIKLDEFKDDQLLSKYTERLQKLGEGIERGYKDIFNNTNPRSQSKIHNMFVELINLFGPKFQDIDGNNEMPRTALSVTSFSSIKGINEQRAQINADYGITNLMVETHRGGDYNKVNAPAYLHKYLPSTIFDLGSNSGFIEHNPPPSFALNFFPESNTVMTTINAAATSLPDLDDNTLKWLEQSIVTIRGIYSERYRGDPIENLPVLIHTFLGKRDEATYSIQFGQVTADEVTYELYGANRRSKCTKINMVKNMRFSETIQDCPIDPADILARQCHIIYGKTCGDGVSIDGALNLGCGVLSNDICCCYRAAIVNGYGFRPCPTAYKFFSTTRNIEVFQTKPKEKFDVTTANQKVKDLLSSLTEIEKKKAEIVDYIRTLNVTATESAIPYVTQLYLEKKNYLIDVINSKTIPDDLLVFHSDDISQQLTVLPENVLKRYCYYTMDQCIGSADFYGRELKQFLVDIKSNIDQIKKLRITSRMDRDKEMECFIESLRIIGNMEHVLSSFIMDKKELVEYSKLFFNSNLARFSGKPFLGRFTTQLNTILLDFVDATDAAQILFWEKMTRLKNYIDQFEEVGTKRGRAKEKPSRPPKRTKFGIPIGSPLQSMRSSGGRGGQGLLLSSVFLTRQSDFNYEDANENATDNNYPIEYDNINDIESQFDSLNENSVNFGNDSQLPYDAEMLSIISAPPQLMDTSATISLPPSHIASVSQAPTLFTFRQNKTFRKQSLDYLFGRPNVSKPKGRSNIIRSTKKMPYKTRRLNKKQGKSIIKITSKPKGINTSIKRKRKTSSDRTMREPSKSTRRKLKSSGSFVHL